MESLEGDYEGEGKELWHRMWAKKTEWWRIVLISPHGEVWSSWRTWSLRAGGAAAVHDDGQVQNHVLLLMLVHDRGIGTLAGGCCWPTASLPCQCCAGHYSFEQAAHHCCHLLALITQTEKNQSVSTIQAYKKLILMIFGKKMIFKAQN